MSHWGLASGRRRLELLSQATQGAPEQSAEPLTLPLASNTDPSSTYAPLGKAVPSLRDRAAALKNPRQAPKPAAITTLAPATASGSAAASVGAANDGQACKATASHTNHASRAAIGRSIADQLRSQTAPAACVHAEPAVQAAAAPDTEEPTAPALPRRKVGTLSFGWDRRYRVVQKEPGGDTLQGQQPSQSATQAVASQSAQLVNSVVAAQSSTKATVQASDDDAHGEEDLWDWKPPADSSKAAGAAAVAPDTDLATLAPKRKRAAAGASGAKRIKAKAAVMEDATHTELAEEAVDTAGGDFAAAPNLANAPTQGPDEPLLLGVDAGGQLLSLPEEADKVHLQMQVPASINKYLRQYQREGVEFLFRQYARALGGILADDMGLGKTVQTIAFVAALLGKTGTAQDCQPLQEQPSILNERVLETPSNDPAKRGPILIVAPSSVVENWKREFDTWGAFRVGIYHGVNRDVVLEAASSGKCEVLITTYDTLRHNFEDVTRIPWHVVIYDEAHKLKDIKTQTYATAYELPTKLRYGLTGTPMQNSHSELWAIINWACPGKLGAKKEFQDYYSTPMKLGQRIDAAPWEVQKLKDRTQQLEVVLERYMLRRTKEGCIKDQLPQKVDNIVLCDLAELQRRAYRRALDSPDFQLLARCWERCDCGSGLVRAKCCHTCCMAAEGGVLWPLFHLCDCNNPRDPFMNPKGCKWHKPEGCWMRDRLMCPWCLTLPCLVILQKISNHLEMLKADPELKRTDLRKFERDLKIADLVLGEDQEDDRLGGCLMDVSFLACSDASTCGKMAALDKLLDLWRDQDKRNKVLVFSHSVRMLNIIEKLIVKKGFEYARLDGSTELRDRQRLCDGFNNPASTQYVMLISTMAGGLGLNLTAANKVVVFDPSWNPAHDLQAQDRAFRIGQRRDVHVYRLVATGTLEELVYTRQLYKQQQAAVAVEGSTERRFFEGVQNDRYRQGELFGIGNLFKMTAETIKTRDIIQREERSEQGYRIELYNAPTLPTDPTSSSTTTQEDEFGMWDVDDAGVEQLANALTREVVGEPPDAAPAATTNAAPGRGTPRSADALSEEEDEEPLEDHKVEQRGLQGAGVLHIVHHDGLLGGRRRASQQPACTPVASAADTSSGELAQQALRSLALWSGVSLAAMAQRLLGMTARQRVGLRRSYAADERNPG